MASQHNQAGLFLHSLRKDCDICTEIELLHAKLSDLAAGGPPEGSVPDGEGGGEGVPEPVTGILPRASTSTRGDWQVDTAFMAEEGFFLVNTPMVHPSRGIDFLQFSLREASYGLLDRPIGSESETDALVGGIDARGRRPRISGGMLQMVDGTGAVVDEYPSRVASLTASGWAGSCIALGSNKWLLSGFDPSVLAKDAGLIWSIDDGTVVLTSGAGIGALYCAFSAVEGPYVVLFEKAANEYALLDKSNSSVAVRSRLGNTGPFYLVNVETGRVFSAEDALFFPQPVGLVVKYGSNVGLFPWDMVEETLDKGGSLYGRGVLEESIQQEGLEVFRSLADGPTSPILRIARDVNFDTKHQYVTDFTAVALQLDSSGMVTIGRTMGHRSEGGSLRMGHGDVFNETAAQSIPNSSTIPNTARFDRTDSLKIWNGETGAMSEVWAFASQNDPLRASGIPHLMRGPRPDGSQLFAFDVDASGAVVIIENGRPATNHYYIALQPSGATAIIPRDQFEDASPLDPRIKTLGNAASLVGLDRSRKLTN